MKIKSDLCYNSWYLHTVHVASWLVWLFSIMQVLQGGNSLGGEIVLEEMAARCVFAKFRAYAKIQMGLSAKVVLADLHKYFHNNTEIETEMSRHNRWSTSRPSFCLVSQNLKNVLLVRTPHAPSACERFWQITRNFPSIPEGSIFFFCHIVMELWYQGTGPEWDITLSLPLYGACCDELIKSYLAH